MTCFDRYVQEHELPVKGCPSDYNYAPRPADCYCISCFKNCWAREIPEENKKNGDDTR